VTVDDGALMCKQWQHADISSRWSKNTCKGFSAEYFMA